MQLSTPMVILVNAGCVLSLAGDVLACQIMKKAIDDYETEQKQLNDRPETPQKKRRENPGSQEEDENSDEE